MDQIGNWIRGISTALGAVLGFILGNLNGLFYALLSFVITDYVTGILAAAVNKELNSSVGFKGIAKKVFIFVIIALAHIVDAQVLGKGDVLRTAAIFFYLSNEGLSIIENSVRIGLPVPKSLKDALEHMNKEDDHE